MLEQSRSDYYYATLHNVYRATIVVDRPFIIRGTHQIARNGVSIAHDESHFYSQSNWFYRCAIRWKWETTSRHFVSISRSTICYRFIGRSSSSNRATIQFAHVKWRVFYYRRWSVNCRRALVSRRDKITIRCSSFF